VGLHADSGCAQESRPSRGPINRRHTLREHGIPPSRQRPVTWHTFLRAHWRAFLAADFFTTEVWTAHGLVTYYTVFVIELHLASSPDSGVHPASR
jgi:hypothetical protein